MSVDKFERYSSGGEVLRGYKGKGFNLTLKGNYGILGKLLSKVSNAVSDTDAVNLTTVNDTCLTMNNGEYDCGMKRITRIGDPKENNDAIE